MPGKVVSRDEWLAARKALLVKEKEHTRAGDALAAERRALPMIKIDTDYVFTGPDGAKLSLRDLFADKQQLIVYHFMYGDKACSGCTGIGESLPDVQALQDKNTNLVCVSRAPVEKLEAYKKDHGWEFPWYSIGDGDFNRDFYAASDGTGMVNFRSKEENEALGNKQYKGDVPGFSVFLNKDGEIYLAYSTFFRGAEKVMPTFTLLDMTPLGRQD